MRGGWKTAIHDKRRAPIIRYRSQKQLTLTGFKTPFETELDASNRWVKLSEGIPWNELAEGYYQRFSTSQRRPTKDARLVIGAVIIKHKLCLSDEETVQQIQDDSMDGRGRALSGTSAENPYLQYFVGLPSYQTCVPFVPLAVCRDPQANGTSGI